jgi:hypothetical protein
VSKSALLTPSNGLLWLQPVKLTAFKPSAGFASKQKTSIDRGCFLFPQELQKLPKPVGYPFLFFTFPSYFPIFFYYFLGVSLLEKSPLLLNFLFLLLAVFFLPITFASFNEILFHLMRSLPLSTLCRLPRIVYCLMKQKRVTPRRLLRLILQHCRRYFPQPHRGLRFD